MKLTQEEFEDRSRAIHGTKYNYSKDTYKDMNTKYVFNCPKHGDFLMRPLDHIHNKQGCKSCSSEDRVEKGREKSAAKLQKHYGGQFTIVDWRKSTTLRQSITVNCAKHGNYTTTTIGALQAINANCKVCNSLEEAALFINKAKKKHGSKYKYNLEDYIDSRTEMKIYCKLHKKNYLQRPSAHLQGQGCPACGKESVHSTKKTSGSYSFFKKANKIYEGFYDYSKTVFTNSRYEVIITCPLHGDFKVTPYVHLVRECGGCSKCSSAKRRETLWDEFLYKIKLRPEYSHFDFTGVVYKDNRSNIDVLCTRHNEIFKSTTNKLLDTNRTISGCKICRKLTNNRWTVRGVRSIPNVGNKSGYFYTGKVSSLEGFKLGITSDLNARWRQYERDLLDKATFGYSNIRESSYLEAVVIEVILKKILKPYFVNHDLDFGGKNEVFNPPDNLYKLVEDIFSGRFDLELGVVTKLATHNNHPSLLNLVKTIKNTYKETQCY